MSCIELNIKNRIYKIDNGDGSRDKTRDYSILEEFLLSGNLPSDYSIYTDESDAPLTGDI